MEAQLSNAMVEFVDVKEEFINLQEQLESVDERASESLVNLVSQKSSITEYEIETQGFEENIYELSIVNQSKLSAREKLLELLPEIVLSIQNQKKGLGAGAT